MADLKGSLIVRIASVYGWRDRGGSSHRHVLEKPGARPVPVRFKLKNYGEARSVLKQLEIPREAWPENLK